MTRARSLAMVLVLFVIYTAGAATAAAQPAAGKDRGVRRPPQPRILYVNDLAVGGEPVQVERHRKIALRGTGSGELPPDDLTLQVVIVRRYDGHVSVTPKAYIERPAGATKSWTWRIDDVEVPVAELGSGYDVQPVMFRGDAGLSGMSDRETVRRLAIAQGAVVQVNVGVTGEAPIVTGACGVQIDAIENVFGHEVAAGGADIEVGLQSALRGTVDAPAGTFLYATVRADGSDRIWVMPDKTSRSGRGFRSTIYTGRDELDFGERFSTQMYLARRPLRADRSYTPDEWRAIEPSICGTSPEVIVRRRVAPGDLRITQIDHVPVISGTTALETTTEPQLEGQITDPRPHNALRLDETVWLLTRLRDTDEGWRVSALAVVHDDRLGFRVPSLRLSQPGHYQVIAVAARTRLPLGRVLGGDDWYRLVRLRMLRRLSKAVLINPTRQ